MGSAACWFLASRGHHVLGLEQFQTPHENGSHAGQSRIIRKAYFEHPDYVPLLERAYDHWRTLEAETDSSLYYRTGILYTGLSQNENIAGIRTAAALHNISIESWSRQERRKRFPFFEVPDDFDTIFEPDAGFVTPERTIAQYVQQARRNGAVIKTQTPVLSWRQEGSRIRVVTPEGEYTSEKLIITAGAWASQVLPQLKAQLHVTRQLLAWVKPADPDVFSLGNFPCWFVEDPALGTFYGFPILTPETADGPIGLKLAHHHPGDQCSPYAICDGDTKPEEEKLRSFLRRYLPQAGEDIIAIKNCLYTYSPDSHFIIDHLPGSDKRVTIACGFSGHGFKFVPVIGEALADLAMKGRTELPIGFLKLERFQ